MKKKSFLLTTKAIYGSASEYPQISVYSWGSTDMLKGIDKLVLLPDYPTTAPEVGEFEVFRTLDVLSPDLPSWAEDAVEISPEAFRALGTSNPNKDAVVMAEKAARLVQTGAPQGDLGAGPQLRDDARELRLAPEMERTDYHNTLLTESKYAVED